jgi:hypothetical protein
MSANQRRRRDQWALYLLRKILWGAYEDPTTHRLDSIAYTTELIFGF